MANARSITHSLTTLAGLLSLASVSTVVFAFGADDWPSYNNDLQSTRFAKQSQINRGNVAKLVPVCSYDLGVQTAFQTGPLVVDGTIYLTSEFSTVALDAATCAVKWRTDETYAGHSLPTNRGAAILDGRLFRGTQDGRVLAYDLATGKQLWATTIGDNAKGEAVPAAPIAWNGLVFAGNAGGDNKGVKGRMYALDAQTGAIRWEQYLVPREAADGPRGPAAPAPKIPPGGWQNKAGAPISGGATWTSYSLDPATGTLFISGGNPAPDFAPQLRPGTNPFAGSVIALDATTGALRKAYPLVERDFHDWDASAAPSIITTRKGRQIVAAAIKDGHLHGLDLTSGTPLYKTPVTTILNATVPLTSRKAVRFCPGSQGGTEWNGPSYSAATNLIYTGAVDWCSTVKIAPDDALVAEKIGQPWSGSADMEQMTFGQFDPPGRWAGWVVATDADTGKVHWRYKTPAPVLAGVTATAGGLVFTADMVGNVFAFDQESGKKLWQTNADGAVGGGVISYATAGGDQRIAVAAGMISPIWPTKKVNAHLVVYGLPK